MATEGDRVAVVARAARAKSPAFQRSIETLRKGRSYQEFVNAIKTKTGLAFSRSYLKRVEAGTLAPNPLLIYALEIMAGGEPSALLLEYAAEAGGSDLVRHGGTGQQITQQGGSVATSSARVLALEGQLAVYKTVIARVRSVVEEAVAAADRDEGRATPREKPKRGRRH